MICFVVSWSPKTRAVEGQGAVQVNTDPGSDWRRIFSTKELNELEILN